MRTSRSPITTIERTAPSTKLSGLWDLNTQDDTVTEGMHDLLVQTVADGADGFRYDAAKAYRAF